jgi:hypothetical protein
MTVFRGIKKPLSDFAGKRCLSVCIPLTLAGLSGPVLKEGSLIRLVVIIAGVGR